MTKIKPDPDPDNHDNDNNREDAREQKVLAAAPAEGALTSLAALGAALNGVDTASVTGRSGMPMLQFKSREGGTWMFGQRRTVPEDGSRWAVNPTTFQRGYICFDPANKPIGEKLLSVGQPMPDPTKLPDKGFEWKEQWKANLKCLDGSDAGAEVTYKPTTTGGIQAITGLIEQIRDRLNGGQHDGKVSPIVRLEKDSYQHSQFGKVWIPLLTVIDWMSLQGPAPAPVAPPPPSSPPPAEQPRRRRVG